jgi:magnesium chelatase accessory protein
MATLTKRAESEAAADACSGLDWKRDGRDWPNRDASRFVRAAGLRWHVQVLGRGPALLLLHGSGGATHSWRALAPLLAKRFEVIAPDLPGHGFSEARGDAQSLPGMARALDELLRVLGSRPALVVGHSAGAAIACRMSLDGRIAPQGVVSLNGALLPIRGIAGHLFPHIATLWTWNPFVSWLLAWRARDPMRVERLIRGTGSHLDPEGIRLYGMLIRNAGHVAGTLSMMAHWDLRPLARDLPRLQPKLMLVVGDQDRFIAPSDAGQIRAMLPDARLVHLHDLGHLAHEERPREVATAITRFARFAGVL